jgi:hypothetical protein
MHPSGPIGNALAQFVFLPKSAKTPIWGPIVTCDCSLVCSYGAWVKDLICGYKGRTIVYVAIVCSGGVTCCLSIFSVEVNALQLAGQQKILISLR